MQKMILRFTDKKGKRIEKRYYPTSDGSPRRFTPRVVPDSIKDCYVYVSYGKKICNLGCLCLFTNQGIYGNRKDYLQAIRSFIAES